MSDTATTDQVAADDQAEFVIEDAVLDHLRQPKDAMKLYREGITLGFLDAVWDEKKRKVVGSEKYAYRAMEFAWGYIQEYGEAPTSEVIREQFQEIPFGDQPTQPVEYTIKRLRERRALGMLREVQKKIARHADEDVVQAVNWGRAQFSEMAQEVVPRGQSLNPDETYLDSRAKYMAAKEAGRIMGYTFGFGPEVDEALGGIRRFTVNMGRPKQMKTWISLHAGIHAAYAGANVVYYSLEMPIEESQGMLERYECMVADLMAREHGIDPHKYMGKIPGTSFNDRGKARWTHEDFNYFDQFMDSWNSERKGSFRLERPPMMQRTTSHLRDLAAGADLAIVDQFDYIEPPTGIPAGMKQWEQIKYTCDALVSWSDDTALLVNHQFSREAVKQKDEESKVRTMGQVEHISGGDTIGRHAHLIVGSLRTRDMKANDNVAFGDVAARSAEGGEWWLGYDLTRGCRMTFEGTKDE